MVRDVMCERGPSSFAAIVGRESGHVHHYDYDHDHGIPNTLNVLPYCQQQILGHDVVA